MKYGIVRNIFRELYEVEFREPHGPQVESAAEWRNSEIKIIEARSRIPQRMLEMLPEIMYTLKGKAFSEEIEWRALTNLPLDSLQHCRFSTRGSTLIPYFDLPIENNSNTSARTISKVIIGSKNPTPTYVVQAFLRSNGFDCAEVIRSASSYR